MLLTEAIKETEKHIHEVTEASIAVPYYFKDEQLNSIRDSVKMVGIHEIKLIYEPIAALIAYGMDRETNSERVLVFNMGGTSIEVSVVEIKNGVMDVISNVADIHFGSTHFN